jgi:hypothetical protein
MMMAVAVRMAVIVVMSVVIVLMVVIVAVLVVEMIVHDYSSRGMTNGGGWVICAPGGARLMPSSIEYNDLRPPRESTMSFCLPGSTSSMVSR